MAFVGKIWLVWLQWAATHELGVFLGYWFHIVLWHTSVLLSLSPSREYRGMSTYFLILATASSLSS